MNSGFFFGGTRLEVKGERRPRIRARACQMTHVISRLHASNRADAMAELAEVV